MLEAIKIKRRQVNQAPPEPVLNFNNILQHSAGDYKSPNTISISAPTHTGETKLRRFNSQGVERDTSELPYSPPSSYGENDITGISIPLYKVEEFRARYNKVKALLFNFSNDMPNIKLIWLRANFMSFVLDITQCTKLHTLDISDNYISNIYWPPNYNNKVNFVYIGGIYMNGSPSGAVITTMMRQLDGNGLTNGVVLSDACVPDARLIDGKRAIESHKSLVDKGWEIGHLTTRFRGIGLDHDTTSHYNDVMSSKYDWRVTSDQPWVTVDSSLRSKSNDIQRHDINFTINTSKETRTANLSYHKYKDDGNGYKGTRVVTIKQDPSV